MALLNKHYNKIIKAQTVCNKLNSKKFLSKYFITQSDYFVVEEHHVFKLIYELDDKPIKPLNHQKN